MNPFLKYDEILHSDDTSSIRIQALVLHLFHSGDYPVDLAFLLRSTDTQHRTAAREMMAWYSEHGESDDVFIAAALRLTGERGPRVFTVSRGCRCRAELRWHEKASRPHLACTKCEEPLHPRVELNQHRELDPRSANEPD